MGDEVLGARLKELRNRAGLTQGELAKKAGISAKAVAQFEQGDRLPAWDSITKLADALGVPLDEFRKAPASDEKAPRGRPPKEAPKVSEPPAAKRGRGRPKKSDREGQ